VLVSTHKGNSIFLISKNILPKIRGYFSYFQKYFTFSEKKYADAPIQIVWVVGFFSQGFGFFAAFSPFFPILLAIFL